MAQLPSPVCMDALKFQNPISSVCSRNQCSVMGKSRISWSTVGHGGRRKGFHRVRVATGDPSLAEDFADDYYAILGLVLSDPVQRMVYDQIHGHVLTAINPFLDDSTTKNNVFVDEFTCIGCKNCQNVCGDVFTIEEEFGRARAYSQSGDPDSVQQAVDSCPVNCIHWISAQQLSLLEDEMRRIERINVAFMLSGMGSGGVDVFRMASDRWEQRQSKILEKAKRRMMSQKESDKYEIIWNNLWGKPGAQRNTEEEAKERAGRAAAAARRWREYSRRGVDKPPTMKLPETVSNTEK